MISLGFGYSERIRILFKMFLILILFLLFLMVRYSRRLGGCCLLRWRVHRNILETIADSYYHAKNRVLFQNTDSADGIQSAWLSIDCNSKVAQNQI
jgi:hypothetical protein